MVEGEFLPEGEPASDSRPNSGLAPREQSLWEELAARDGELGGLYLQGVRLKEFAYQPGVSYLLAHVGREISNAVIGVVVDEDWGIPPDSKVANDEGSRQRSRIAGILGLAPEDARVIEWNEVHNALVASTHFRGVGVDVEGEEVLLNFRRLEALLFGRIGPYFETRAELDELLKEEAPTDEALEELRSLLGRGQQRQYFFQNLQHLEWVEKLESIGSFRHPPEMITLPDGGWRAVPWPEVEYLARIASQKPEVVVDIVERLPKDIKNPAVWREVAKIASVVPPDSGHRLVPALRRASGAVLPCTFVDELTEVVVRLASGGRLEAFDLASELLFVPGASDLGEVQPFSLRTQWMLPRIRWGTFQKFSGEAIPALEATDPERTLRLLIGKVRQIGAVAEKLDLTRWSDGWYALRSKPESDDVVGQLVEATAAAVARSGQKSGELAAMARGLLGAQPRGLMQLLRYRLLAAAGPHLSDELDSMIAGAAAHDESGWGRELARVLRAQFHNASPKAQSAFRRNLGAGPPETWVEGLVDDRADGESPEERRRSLRERWQVRRLTWFRGDIPDELQSLAKNLGVWGRKPTWEEQEMAEIGSFSRGAMAVSEPTPFTAEDLVTRKPQEIARILIEWEPGEPATFDSPTRRGLELAFSNLTSSYSDTALEVWDAAGGRLPLPVIWNMLAGLRASIDEETSENRWHRIVSMASTAVQVSRNSPKGTGRDAQQILDSISDLIRESSRENLFPESIEDGIWKTVLPMVTGALESEEPSSFDRFHEVHRASLLNSGPRALWAAIELALWSFRIRDDLPQRETVAVTESRLAPILDLALSTTGSARLLSEAVLGRYLPFVRLVSPTWIDLHLDGLLEGGASNPLDHPAWGAYLVGGPLYKDLFESLREWYVVAAETGWASAPPSADPGEETSISEGLARHLIIAVVRGLVSPGDPDELLEKGFRNIPPADRCKAYWSLYRGWSQAQEKIPIEFSERLIRFWRWRLDEIEDAGDAEGGTLEARGLSWFVFTPHLPDGEVVTLAFRTIRRAEGDLDAPVDWDRLGSLVKQGPDQVLGMTEILVAHYARDRQGWLRGKDLYPLLANVLAEGPGSTKQQARRLIHRLGELGFEGLADLAE